VGLFFVALGRSPSPADALSSRKKAVLRAKVLAANVMGIRSFADQGRRQELSRVDKVHGAFSA
jgi:hypothetical protein